MIKNLLFLFVIIFNLTTYGQQIEIGPVIGYGADNIADYKSDAARAVIGNSIWDVSYGLSALYYFKSPNDIATGRIGLLFQHSTRGSVSETYPNNRFKFMANTIGISGGVARDIGTGYILYFDGGFGYSFLDNRPFYRGSETQLEAFEDLDDELSIKDSQVIFLYGMGVEKNLAKDKFKISIGITGDAGISKVNEGSGSFRTQAIWFSGGIRYIFPLRTNE